MSIRTDDMSVAIPHDQVRETQDRSWTFALLDELRSASTSAAERDEVGYTLTALEDYRAIGPLTAMVEDDQLPASVRKAASDAVRGLDDATTGERRRGWWASGDPVKMEHALCLMGRSEADIVLRIAGDDGHPWQELALSDMLWGFDEAQFQPAKIRALAHPDPKLREAAADILLWDEPVAAEEPLLSATRDPSSEVAVAAVDTLQYYPSRRVLRTLAELTAARDDQVRAKAAESFDEIRSEFEYLAGTGEPEPVALLREWMRPVADLVRWPDEVQEREPYSPPAESSRVAIPERELLGLILDPDGEWAPKKEVLRKVDWDHYGMGERERLCEALISHPDPVVREAATEPLADWSRSEELLRLARDPSAWVRKSAMYQLGQVPRDPALAPFVWDYVLGAAGTSAYEALRTYVAHASAGEAKERLTDLARDDPRESIRTGAIIQLVDLGATRELDSLVALLREPPGVTWAVHIEILDGLRALGLRAPEPELDRLAAVDHLDLIRSVVALRCTSRG